MDDEKFNARIEERIAKGILKPMSKEMVRDYLKYSGAMNEETRKMYDSFWELYQEDKIEIFWNNEENEIALFRSRNYPK